MSATERKLGLLYLVLRTLYLVLCPSSPYPLLDFNDQIKSNSIESEVLVDLVKTDGKTQTHLLFQLPTIGQLHVRPFWSMEQMQLHILTQEVIVLIFILAMQLVPDIACR